MEYAVQELGANSLVLPSPNLGDKKLEALLGTMLEKWIEEAEGSFFLVTWNGTERVPRLEIGDHSIQWTQHGVVYDAGGKMIGSYERLKDVEGPQQENAMLIKIWS